MRPFYYNHGCLRSTFLKCPCILRIACVFVSVQNSVKSELDSRHLFRSDPSALSFLSARTPFPLRRSSLLRPFDLCRAFAFGESVYPGNLSINTHRLAPPFLDFGRQSHQFPPRRTQPHRITVCSAPPHGESELRAGSRLLLCSPSQSTTTVCLFARGWAAICFRRHRSLDH